LITFTTNYCSISLVIMTSRDKLANIDIIPNNKDQTNETLYSFRFNTKLYFPVRLNIIFVQN